MKCCHKRDEIGNAVTQQMKRVTKQMAKKKTPKKTNKTYQKKKKPR